MRKKTKKRRYVTYGAKARKKPCLNMRFIAKWSVFAFVLLVTAVVYVGERNTIISLGYRINALQKDITQAENEELKLHAELVGLQRPDWLWREVKDRALGLERESPKQVITLSTPRKFELSSAKRRAAHHHPAVSRIVGKLSVATPPRESSVRR